MARYFDIDNAAHLALLPVTFREHSDIEYMANKAEDDVIEQYTEFLPDSSYTDRQYSPEGTEVDSETGLYVLLREYTVDADAANATFATALRKTIADVILHRFRVAGVNPLVSAEATDVGRSKTYTPWAESAFPKNWNWRLMPYDTRERGWGL